MLLSFLALAACRAPIPPATPGAEGFDAEFVGWNAASTGGQGMDATWMAVADERAVSAPAVLSLTATNHASEDRYNLYWSDTLRFRDGRLGVAMRADAGSLDQGGGLCWRVQDPANYYVCRLNPLESNYRVYVVKDGVRKQLGSAMHVAKAGEWHLLGVEHVGDRIRCWCDGKLLLEARDAAIAGPGGVGLWTKADARSSFDDLVVQAR